eukprot:GAHX01000429.1.p1 GENE.GAHX01000429.1~~GAHX01000429.1.p1  ORF type:complete len:407 (-),score=80.43 GAHX01000429.1:36-1256(-)
MPSEQEKKILQLQNNIKYLIELTPINYSKNVYRHKKGGISYYDSTGQTTAIIKDIVKILFKSIMGGPISLPIRIYEPRSFLERLTDTWLDFSAPFTKAASTKDSRERFLCILGGILSGFSYAFLKQQQSFNPTLGETAQVTLPCGLKCFMEQVSHHPPVTRFEGWDSGSKYRIHGDVTLDYKLGYASVSGQQTGKTYIDLYTEYNNTDTNKENENNINNIDSNVDNIDINCKGNKDAEKYYYTLPGIKIDGLETRHCYFSGKLSLVCEEYELELYFSPNTDTIKSILGGLADTRTIAKLREIKDFMCGMLRDKKGDGKTVWPIYGCWLDKAFLGINEIWGIDRNVGKYTAEHFGENYNRDGERVMPSDSQNRIDIVELKKSNFSKAQENKYIIEKVQRIEAKLRKK